MADPTPKPTLLETPNLEALRTLVQEHLDGTATGHCDRDSDEEHYIYEAAMEAFFGKDVWKYVNEQVALRR